MLKFMSPKRCEGRNHRHCHTHSLTHTHTGSLCTAEKAKGMSEPHVIRPLLLLRSPLQWGESLVLSVTWAGGSVKPHTPRAGLCSCLHDAGDAIMNTSTWTVLTPLGAQVPWRLWVHSVLQYTLARCAVLTGSDRKWDFLNYGPTQQRLSHGLQLQGPSAFWM